MAKKKKGSQPVVMPKDKNGPMKISLGPVAIGHQSQTGGHVHKDKSRFNKGDRGKNNRQAIQQG